MSYKPFTFSSILFPAKQKKRKQNEYGGVAAVQTIKISFLNDKSFVWEIGKEKQSSV